MSSLWHYTRESLDKSVILLSEDLRNLQAAKPVDVAEIIKQFEVAAESVRNLRSLVSAEMPEAAWQSREELEDTHCDHTEKYGGQGSAFPACGSGS